MPTINQLVRKGRKKKVRKPKAPVLLVGVNKNLSILLSMPNVFITSHQAFFTKEALNKIASDTLENIKKEMETGTCENEL